MGKQLKKIAGQLVSVSKSGYGKIAAGASTALASGMAMAQAGDSPGAAVAGELAGGKTDVMLVVSAAAVIVGLLALWAYVKRAH